MDGDEGQQSTAVAVCGGAMGDGAEELGDAAPPPAEGDADLEERAPGTTTAAAADPDEALTDEALTDEALTGEALTDGALTDGALTDGVVIEDAPEGGEPEPTTAAVVLHGAERFGAVHPYVRRGIVALVAAGLVALAVGAVAWIVPSLEGSNRRFVAAAESRGLVIAPGEQEALVLSAARKICDRKVAHYTLQERRSTALTSAELAAVGAVFGDDIRDFTAFALDAYCSR